MLFTGEHWDSLLPSYKANRGELCLFYWPKKQGPGDRSSQPYHLGLFPHHGHDCEGAVLRREMCLKETERKKMLAGLPDYDTTEKGIKNKTKQEEISLFRAGRVSLMSSLGLWLHALLRAAERSALTCLPEGPRTRRTERPPGVGHAEGGRQTQGKRQCSEEAALAPSHTEYAFAKLGFYWALLLGITHT